MKYEQIAGKHRVECLTLLIGFILDKTVSTCVSVTHSVTITSTSCIPRRPMHAETDGKRMKVGNGGSVRKSDHGFMLRDTIRPKQEDNVL